MSCSGGHGKRNVLRRTDETALRVFIKAMPVRHTHRPHDFMPVRRIQSLMGDPLLQAGAHTTTDNLNPFGSNAHENRPHRRPVLRADFCEKFRNIVPAHQARRVASGTTSTPPGPRRVVDSGGADQPGSQHPSCVCVSA